MAKCKECGCWYPAGAGPTKRKLIPLYHDFDCSLHFMVPEEVWGESGVSHHLIYAFDLEHELGEQFGHADLAMYLFEGNHLYEVDSNGNRRVVSTFTEYPKKVEEPKETDYEKWIREEKENSARIARKENAAAELEKARETKPEKSEKKEDTFSFNYQPWKSVDRAKWPRLWWFYFKMAFLPDAHKDIKYSYPSSGGSQYPSYQPSHHDGHRGHSRGRWIAGQFVWDGDDA